MKRIKYFFDNMMSKGTAVMLAILSFVMIAIVAIIAFVIIVCGFSEDEGVFYTVWDVLSTTINAWMPSSEDGGIGYVLMIALSAIIGLFFTSFVIGIISSGIEEKLSQLRKGNSDIAEKGHIVVLGFDPGKYTLLQQLALAADKTKSCIVVAESMDKEEMEECIRDNIERPRGVRIVCRNLEVTDPTGISKCSIDTARLVIVNPIEDKRTVKTLLAVSRVLEDAESIVPVFTTISDNEYHIPRLIREKNRFVVLRTGEIISRIIAHSCMQPGLANAFFDVFDFEGNEMYVEQPSDIDGSLWSQIVLGTAGGVPIGVIRENETIINPEWNYKLKNGDGIITFEKELGVATIGSVEAEEIKRDDSVDVVNEPKTIMIIGYNDRFDMILRELPREVLELVIVDNSMEEDELIHICAEYGIGIRQTYPNEVLRSRTALEEAVSDVSHIIILGDDSLDEDDADVKCIMNILNLKDIRSRLGLEFTITTEMKREDNRALVADEGIIDFIVSSDMSSMVLTQMAITPKLYDAFHELLSNDGEEFVLKPASFAGVSGKTVTTLEVRRALLEKKYVFLGYIKKNEKEHICLNPALNDTCELGDNDMLIVIGAKAETAIERPACG